MLKVHTVDEAKSAVYVGVWVWVWGGALSPTLVAVGNGSNLIWQPNCMHDMCSVVETAAVVILTAFIVLLMHALMTFIALLA